jgi:hypothetical protein
MAVLGHRAHGDPGQDQVEAGALGYPLGVGQQQPGQRPPDVAAPQQADSNGRPAGAAVFDIYGDGALPDLVMTGPGAG